MKKKSRQKLYVIFIAKNMNYHEYLSFMIPDNFKT